MPKPEDQEALISKAIANPRLMATLGPTLAAIVGGVWFISNEISGMRLAEMEHHSETRAAIVQLENKQDIRIARLETSYGQGERWTREDMRNYVATMRVLNPEARYPEIK